MDLRTAEHWLQDAQRANDVAALDELLHPRLVARAPDGSVVGKEDDLGAYRSGVFRITGLVEESLDVQEDGPTA